MQFDQYGFIRMEQTDFPGSVGDSAAETGRFWTLLMFVIGTNAHPNLQPFVTKKGILRHPESPWREDDTSGDQVSPLLAATSILQPIVADQILNHIYDAKYRTGNGNLISPGLFAMMRRCRNLKMLWISDLAIVGQALLMKLPVRWSDSKKALEWVGNSSADYLNFINFLVHAESKKNSSWPCWLAKKLISKKKMVERVKSYYEPEPNCDQILDLYARAIEKL